MSSVIYRRNREKMNSPFLPSDFAQVSAVGRYRQFSDFCTSMVKCGFWMLQMKLQLFIVIFHRSKTPPAISKVIWWFLMPFEAVIVFDNRVGWTSRQMNWSMVEIRFLGFQYRYDDSDIRLQGDFCICLCEIISDILSHWLSAVGWRSVSATRLRISQWDRCHRQIILP